MATLHTLMFSSGRPETMQSHIQTAVKRDYKSDRVSSKINQGLQKHYQFKNHILNPKNLRGHIKNPPVKKNSLPTFYFILLPTIILRDN